jgi:hypothetical protein
VIAAAGAAVAAGLAVYAAVDAGRGVVLLAILGGLAVLVALVGALRGLALPIGVGLAGLIVEYAVAAGLQGSRLETRAAVWGAGLLLAAELLFLAGELRTSVLSGGDLIARRLGTVAWLVTGAIVVCAVLVSAAELRPGGGLALQLAGAVAVAGVLALVLSLARR